MIDFPDYDLECPVCGAECEDADLLSEFKCECGATLEVDYDYMWDEEWGEMEYFWLSEVRDSHHGD